MEGRRQSQAVSDTYRARLTERQAAAAHLERRHALLAWARLGLFLVGVAIVIALGRTSAPWLSIPIILFPPLAFVHARVLNAKDRADRAISFYERGLARLDDRWQGGGQQGERFRDPSHLYAEDLDLFGKGSLFELLASSRTTGGESVLADWLKAPAAGATIALRQQAITELAPRLDFREELNVLGPEVEAGVRSDDLIAWAEGPPILASRWPQFVLPLIAAASTTLVVRWFMTGTPSDWLVPVILVQLAAAFIFRKRVHEVQHGVEQREHELQVLSMVMQRLEAEPVDSELLVGLREQLRTTGRSPAAEIRSLARLVEIMSSSHNLVFGPIAAMLLLNTQLAFVVERWRYRCGPAVRAWLQAVAEYEALSALATYASEHPEAPFPELIDGDATLEGTGLTHPLLSAAVAVANDVQLGGSAAHLLVVSGSNMSGKSTLLRTVGLNAVLAMAGAPVSAQKLRMTPLAIGATLRIQDSLQEGRSRFFAEITRISEIVALARERHLQISKSPNLQIPPPVLFLFDELLAGTNSHDRLQGSTGILRALVGFGSIGLITTHDLALTAIVDGLEGRASNVHFDDRFEDGVLHFDFTLRPGVVHAGNAIPLMRSVGLDV